MALTYNVMIHSQSMFIVLIQPAAVLALMLLHGITRYRSMFQILLVQNNNGLTDYT